jgi:hypothetical protein
MRTDIIAGAVFPDYELTDHTGTRRKLSDLQGPDPMVLVRSADNPRIDRIGQHDLITEDSSASRNRFIQHFPANISAPEYSRSSRRSGRRRVPTKVAVSSTRVFLQTFYTALDLSHTNAVDFSTIVCVRWDTAHLPKRPRKIHTAL